MILDVIGIAFLIIFLWLGVWAALAVNRRFVLARPDASSEGTDAGPIAIRAFVMVVVWFVVTAPAWLVFYLLVLD